MNCPQPTSPPKPAAALVVHHGNVKTPWQGLIGPGPFVRGYSLVPVQAVDFYPKRSPA